MPSIGSTLSIAVSAMRAQQEALDVAAHNIANANTEGYSRQRPVFSARDPLVLPSGVFGTGVQVLDVQIVRDSWLEATYWRESSSLGENGVRSDLMGRVETLLMEPGDSGLSSGLDAFFSAWSELASNPTSSTGRVMVQQAGAHLASQLRGMAAGLDTLRGEAENRLLVAVDRVNELAREIGRLNERIVAAESGGGTAGDLRDARGRALDELSGLVPIQVAHREGGGVGVSVSGVALVDGAYASALEVKDLAGVLGVGLETSAGPLPQMGGEVGGLLGILGTVLPDLRSELDDLAQALVAEVNALHQTGTNSAGDTGIDFFHTPDPIHFPDGVSASSIRLSDAILADSQAIAVGTADGSGDYRAGANDVALALAELRDTSLGGLGDTLGNHFRKLVSSVGLEGQSARNRTEAHRVLAEQADTRRTSYSGVSTDEELVKLIQAQTGYAAAARIVTTADEMLKTLLAM
jgi:flagellar hook-associated protein 1